VNELVAGATQRQQTVIYGRQRESKQAPDCTQSAAAAAAGKPVRRPPPSTSTRNHPRNLTQIGLYRRGKAAATAAGVAWRGVSPWRPQVSHRTDNEAATSVAVADSAK